MPARSRSAETIAQRGRPRSADASDRALDATLAILRESGMQGLTTSAVCSRAGISRTTFYRRWANPIETLLSAIDRHFTVAQPQPQLSLEEEFTQIGLSLFRAFADPAAAPAIAFMVAEHGAGAIGDRAAADFRRRRALILRHLDARLAEARAGREGGLSAGTILDMLNGFAFFSTVTDVAVDVDTVRDLVRRLIA